jgi:hypothetical protein
MRTFTIEFEIVLKDTAEPELRDDFIYRAIEEQLEAGEFIDSYFIEEKRDKSCLTENTN